MSEIWTPGSPPPSQSSGGIELPKGFATSRREEQRLSDSDAEEPNADERATSPSSETPAAQEVDASEAAKGQQSEIDLLFPPTGAQVTCPNCGAAYTAAVFTIVDLGANPELKGLLLAGQINTAVCNACGVGGPLSVPLMVHEPEHEFLGVVVPGQARLDDMQTQKMIGEMSQALMARLPADLRKGYMFQAQQFFEWDSLIEKLWGFEGVTPEMLRRRREQTDLISNLVRLGSDESAMKMVADRNKALIDSSFFVLLGQVIGAVEAEGQSEQHEALLNLRNSLLESTEAGQELKELEERVQEALSRIGPNTTREELLSQLLNYWTEGENGEAVATAVLNAAAGLTDYHFLLGLADRLENSTDPEERSALIAMRERIVEIGEQRSQSQQMAAQQVQAVLQEVLQAPDAEAALKENAEHINEMFLAVLASNIRQAEQNKAAFAAQRLRTIYEKAVAMLEEQMPPEMRLLNRLLSAPDEGAMRRLLQENRSDLSKEFVDAMKSLEERFSREGNSALASRVRSIRGQAALLL